MAAAGGACQRGRCKRAGAAAVVSTSTRPQQEQERRRRRGAGEGVRFKQTSGTSRTSRAARRLRAAVGDEEECLQAAAAANTSVSLLGGNPPGDAVDDVQKLREECLGMKKVWSCRGERPSVVSSRLMRNLSPAWKMMLLSDGSVTRHVELLTGGDVKVECLEMKTCNENENENLLVPPEVSAIPGPVIQRQVLLYSESVAEPCVYAVSWWNEAKAEAFLTDVKSPIWVNLSDNKTELFREVKTLYEGHSPQLERRMGVEGPFWARHYCFWHGDELLTVIFEAFSNKLDDYLSDDLCA